MLQFLSSEGKIVNKKGLPKIAAKELKRIYELMVLSRVFDDIALKLQREGRMLTFASLLGQEASQVASSVVFENDDWFVPTYRDHGVLLARGFPLKGLYLYYAGDERGMEIPKEIQALPPTIPIGSHIPHAVGIAWAQKLQKRKSVCAVYFGEGSTSKGDFHEGINFAGVFKVPCIFICQNNQWAISVPTSRQTASESFVKKAEACGIEGVLVDGNDALAVYKATKDACDKARKGGGPTFIECYTYRLESHTTADDWKRYRSQKEVDSWKRKDPLLRLAKYMKKEKLLSKKEEKEIFDSAQQKVKEEVAEFEATPLPKAEDMFKYIP
ncbi:MAG: pyruvate dehydrogenase E1 component subunit alpha [Parcubacteria group bacterium Gr01-1014_30]|nr:MAG: pyruvate dehydrogenase E1 component subunit alpha [Parcubacteria group bacterium Gr01-1014_30]